MIIADVHQKVVDRQVAAIIDLHFFGVLRIKSNFRLGWISGISLEHEIFGVNEEVFDGERQDFLVILDQIASNQVKGLRVSPLNRPIKNVL